MSEKSCVKCVFAVSFIPRGEIKRSYMCKRLPPVPVVVGIDPTRGPAVTAQHPVVHENQWCHEFAAEIEGQSVPLAL